jgi:hypothetical protein
VPSDDERKQGARRILTKLDAFEVSPVIIGAGVGTRTLGVKAADVTAVPGSGDRSGALAAEAGRGGRARARRRDEAARDQRRRDRRFRRPPWAAVGGER